MCLRLRLEFSLRRSTPLTSHEGLAEVQGQPAVNSAQYQPAVGEVDNQCVTTGLTRGTPWTGEGIGAVRLIIASVPRSWWSGMPVGSGSGDMGDRPPKEEMGPTEGGGNAPCKLLGPTPQLTLRPGCRRADVSNMCISEQCHHLSCCADSCLHSSQMLGAVCRTPYRDLCRCLLLWLGDFSMSIGCGPRDQPRRCPRGACESSFDVRHQHLLL